MKANQLNMGNIRIKAVVRSGGNERTFAGSLAKNGYAWLPGCGTSLTPYREGDGRYRTGLDEKALYINQMPKEEQEIERKRVRDLYEELVSTTGLDLRPTSDYYAKPYDDENGSKERVRSIKISDKDVILDSNKPQDLVTAAWLMVHPVIARSLADTRSGNGGPSKIAYIYNPEAETEDSYSQEIELDKAKAKLVSLKAPQLRRIARILEAPINEDSSQEAAYLAISKILKKGTVDFGSYKNKSSVRVFNDLMEMSEATLSIKDLVKRAITLSIYRRNKAGVIMQGENKIADSEEDLIANLASNTEERTSLEMRVKAKTKINQE